MKIKFVIITSIITVLFQHFTYAQEFKNFSDDTTKFPDELSSFMEKNLSDENKDVLNKFLKTWQEDSLYSPDEQKQILEISQLLVKKNAKPSPYFIDYLTCVMLFKEKNLPDEEYQTWEKGTMSLLKRKKTTLTNINQLFNFTINLLNNNILYKSSSTVWKASQSNYNFVFDKDLQVKFEKTNLTCYAKRDSISLFETTGTYYPFDNLWKGKNGLVNWKRGGLDSNMVFATIPEYEIDMSRSEYVAKDVTFTNKFYFSAPLKGVLTDKVKFIKTPEDATYPQFDSYTKSFKIKDLYANINYDGGLSMQGAKLVGTGNRENKANLYIFQNDTLRLVARSNYFGFRKDRINSQNTEIIIKLNRDSIYHPDLSFTFMVPTRELTLLRTDNFTSQSPYFDSYHKVDMTFDQLNWKMTEPFMSFSPSRGAAIGNANFESVNFFNNSTFMKMQGMDRVHPLISIRSFAKHFGSNEFTASDYADYLKMPLSQVRQLLMRMSVGGFVFYDDETQTAKIKPRLNDYVAASVNKIDYDVISFPSTTRSPMANARFDLRTFDLTINGIPRIFLSDSQNVVIIPKDERIVLKHNRNFQFDGTVNAGLFTFQGKNFFFQYDSFKINLQNVDALNIRFQTGKVDNYGFPLVAQVQNMLQHITGELLIDEPNNKSGRKPYPEYPIFRSKENSFVYYDDKSILNGAYKPDNFFFEVDSFTMDSLDNFNKNSMVFKGRFKSAGILPEMDETLSLQSDNSLGFTRSDPEGIPVYGGKGVFKNVLNLSNKGLRGDGNLDYLTSVTQSKNFIFYPDSMETTADDFTIHQQLTETQYPKVNSANNKIHWLPYKDQLFAQKTDKNFKILNDSTFLSGSLKLEPSGLSGNGKMDLRNSDLISNLFTYKALEIAADTANFNLKSLHKEGYTVLTENVNAHIDYTKKEGRFRSNEDFTLVTFPENKYVSFLDNFTWKMDHQELEMGKSDNQEKIKPSDQSGEELTGPRYICVDPKQDSLSFVSPRAVYDYKDNLLKANDVSYIEVADAWIYPDSGKLVVEPNAKMRTLINAKILANDTTKYHTIHSATVAITSKKYYSGNGDYDYIDETGEKQLIHFNEIKVDSGLQTIASGEILEQNDFTLSPNYAYQGKVFLHASQKLLTFKGAAKIEDNCDKLQSDWLNFESQIDPDSIYIPVPVQPQNINLTNIYNGIFLYYDSVHLYPAFLSGRKNYSDHPIISSSGYLYYNKAQQLYKIASKEKLQDMNQPGNYFSLHRENCSLYGEGKLDLGVDMGQVKLTTVGNIRHNTVSNTTTLDMLMGIDFYIDPDIMNILAYEIDSLPNLKATDLNRSVYKKGMNELVGVEQAQILRDQLGLFGEYKEIPPALKHTIVFNELTMKWDEDANSFRSVGKIGIASIDNVQINKEMDGMIEIQVKRSGDLFDIYLEADPHHWYYFGYTRGVMQTLTSNNEFIDKINAKKPKDRRQKVESGRTSYIYMVSTNRKKDLFLRRYREAKDENNQEEDQ